MTSGVFDYLRLTVDWLGRDSGSAVVDLMAVAGLGVLCLVGGLLLLEHWDRSRGR